jgi:hypothetical protein
VPFTIDFDPRDGVTIVRAFGQGSYQEGEVAIEAALTRPESTAGWPLLFDVRQLAYKPSLQDAEGFAQRFARTETLRQLRVAFVVEPGAGYGAARMLSTLANLQGGTTAAFTDLGKALRWLKGWEGLEQ